MVLWSLVPDYRPEYVGYEVVASDEAKNFPDYVITTGRET